MPCLKPSRSRAPVTAAALLLATGLLAGCGFPVDQRGNDPPKVALAQIQPGVTTKATVTKMLGSPSSVATFDHDTWYYISQKTQDEAFFKPQLRGEKVVIISFNNKGVVDQISYRGMKDRDKIVPNPNATPAPGREFTILEQLIGNFGRFSNQPAQPGGGPSQVP